MQEVEKKVEAIDGLETLLSSYFACVSMSAEAEAKRKVLGDLQLPFSLCVIICESI
jgi:hypothetical protein